METAKEVRNKKGVLLLNVGSPEKPEVKAIRKYLREFLSDYRIISVPWLIRWLVLLFFILPFRPSKILVHYQKIWDKEGFPLIKHGQRLQDGLSNALGEEHRIELGMSYGSPSIERALDNLFRSGVSELFIFPLFPQYSSAATGSALEKTLSLIARRPLIPKVVVLSSFYDHPGFIECWREIGKEHYTPKIDHVLFSFHGLPESHIKNHAANGYCLSSPDCCRRITSLNSMCYRAQCINTAERIALKLEIPKEQYSVAFQSRLGRGDWIKPYTNYRVKELAKSGVKNLLVLCPSFVADCLETIHEISIEERKNFLKHGGKNLILASSLNSRPQWIQTVLSIIKSNIG